MRPSFLPRVAALVAAVALAAAVPASPGARAAEVSTEYGPQAESLFVSLCAARPGASEAGCARLCEGLQTMLGYEGFLAAAHRGPEGYDPAVLAAASAIQPAPRRAARSPAAR